MEFVQIMLIGRYCSGPGVLFRLQVLYESFNNSMHSNSSSVIGIDFKKEDTMSVVQGYLVRLPNESSAKRN